jgi:ferredoxin
MHPQSPSNRTGSPGVIQRPDLEPLVTLLQRRGFTVVGPTVKDGAIVYDQIDRLEQLPAGWTDAQEPGGYRLARRSDAALFGYAASPSSWKRFLHPPQQRLFELRREGAQVEVRADGDPPRYAFLGARACDLQAIALFDRVLASNLYRDSAYQSRRAQLFVVAVECADPASTCFCASMGSGPRVSFGFDLVLTEILEGEHRFLVQAGSEAGADLLQELRHRSVEPADLECAERARARAAAAIRRTLDTGRLRELLFESAEHPHWQRVAARCLTCANCTLVCPTCFCTSVEDTSDLTGQRAERWRKWNSCFSLDFSYIHGGSVRSSPAARYRHWLTHKLGSWWDQFGSSGCVGCGRCITWCPVGIDLTEEVRALRPEEVRVDRHDD